MEYQEFPAPPEWSRFIHCTWYLRGFGDGVFPVVPDGRAEIVVHLGEPFGILDASGNATRQAEVMVSGQLTRPIRLLPSAHAAVAGVRLTSAGAGALLPIAALADRVIPLVEVNPVLAGAVLDAFAGRPLAGDSLRRAAGVIAGSASRAPSPMVRGTVAILEAGSPTGLRSLAAAWGVTPRTLQRRFLSEVGTTPGLLRRIIRFRRAFRLLNARGARGFADAAVAAGYFDQAHLIRDFRRFAGVAPRRFFSANPDLAAAFLGGEPA